MDAQQKHDKKDGAHSEIREDHPFGYKVPGQFVHQVNDYITQASISVKYSNNDVIGRTFRPCFPIMIGDTYCEYQDPYQVD
jgi:hypothetical protein